MAHCVRHLSPRAPTSSLFQEALKELKKELTAALEDVEGKLDQLGGSASTVSTRTARSVATKRSVAPSTAAISEAGEE